jgi:ribosomal-protein-alanine N-acetyltransferase
MTSPITIRDVGAEGVEEAMLTMRDAFDPAYGEAWTAPQTLTMLDLPGVWLSLARYDGQPAGFALNRIVADEAELLLLAVASPYRRKGLGSALIEHSCAIARERKAFRIFLEVRHNNPALQLYESCGFTVVGRRSGYYRDQNNHLHDAMTLSCLLDRG